MPIPETRYARAADGASVAYQVYGSGEHRIVAVPGIIFNVEFVWEWPPNHHYFERMGRFATVAQFDKRGTGCSDRLPDAASVEERMEDIHVVMDAVGWDRATILGLSEGGPMACLFAATYPERAERLVLQGSAARFTVADDYPVGGDPDNLRQAAQAWADTWGRPDTLSVPLLAASQVGNEGFLRWMNRFERLSSTPADLLAAFELDLAIDVRHVLPSIRVPTLVVHGRGDNLVPLRWSRYLANEIPGACLVEYDGDHVPPTAGVDEHVDAIERFVTGTTGSAAADRVLATVLFTDICGSTARAVELGDGAWRDLLDRHEHTLRAVLAGHGGREVNTTGDGMVCTFDSPTRAVRCAAEMVSLASSGGVALRAGLHTGEVERRGHDIAGIAVHIAARVADLATPGEVLVSAAVPPLVVGSGLSFTDRGTHELKGVPGTWATLALDG
jgi:class 3 adenylate cyclase/alpha-beta hydrolase superfamily lysophospholipase